MPRSQGNELLGSRIVGGNTAYNRNKSDFYPTPHEVTEALLDFLDLEEGTRIWEPACGEGHITSVLKERGYDVVGTDIQTGVDFLKTENAYGAQWIITNPPFSLAEQFIRKCWGYHIPFALLLKSQFWNAKKRYDLFRECTPTWVLPLTWRPDFLFKTRGGSPLMDVNWCVWSSFGKHMTSYYPLTKREHDEMQMKLFEGNDDA